MRWEIQTKPLQIDRLVVTGLTDTTTPNLNPHTSRQHYIDRPNLRRLIDDPLGFIPQMLLAAQLSQHFPQDIGQRADQNMRLDPILTLMPNGTDPQVTLVNPKCRLSLRKLHVQLPQLLATPVGNIGV